MSDTSSSTSSRSASPEPVPTQSEPEKPSQPSPSPAPAASAIVIPDTLRQDLREYLDLCKQIKEANVELKVFKERCKELGQTISDFMEQHTIPSIDTPNGKISCYQANKVTPLNKDYFREAIQVKFTDKAVIDELTALAFERPSTTVPRIKVIPRRKT